MAEQLKTFAEKQAEKAESLSFCSGIKLLHIRKSVKELLDFIGTQDIFFEYTKHNISHVDEMLGITEWLIPQDTNEIMTSAEWLMLVLAIYFHDMGMVVTKKEYENRYATGFAKYKEDFIKSCASSEWLKKIDEDEDKYLYQEFVRENHAIRIKNWIEGKNDITFGDGGKIISEINSLFDKLDQRFRNDLAMICESHHCDDIDDFHKYKVDKAYGNDNDEKVNLSYIAIILRVADLLHITCDRTPSISRRMINVSNPISVIEWEKQQAVKAVKPMKKRNEEGNIDENLEKDTIEITAYFANADMAEAFFGLSSYLQYTKKELKRCNEIVGKAQKTEGTTKYRFPWVGINDEQIEVVGFSREKLQFVIEQDNILQLLVGHTLYNDSSVVVRELVQNGIDAIKLQRRIDKENKATVTEGHIDVEWFPGKKELIFWDNGTGMTEQEIKKYLLTVGASKYRAEEFIKKYPDFYSISHFGIGILTCFMISDDIDIITNTEMEEKAFEITLRKVNGSYLLRNRDKSDIDLRIKKHGTMIKLHIRTDVDMSSTEMALRKWIILPGVRVEFHESGKETQVIGYTSLKEALAAYLSENGIVIDDKNYRIDERHDGNVTVAYALQHLKYLSDWTLIQINNSNNKGEFLPIGTCIEGIRVEFTTPGYKNPNFFAIANIENSKFQTNVARSAIEFDANREVLADIYSVYANYLQNQMDSLVKLNYSQSWAINEGAFLMYPLVTNDPVHIYDNSHVEPVDKEILIKKLAQIKCIVLENPENRKIVSAEEAASLDEITIIESKLLESTECLLREITSTATLHSIMNLACKTDYIKDVPNLITNYKSSNVLHNYVLHEKEVQQIIINREQRSIHLTYKTKTGLWRVYNIEKTNNSLNQKLFVPNTAMPFEGIDEEIGIHTTNGIYLCPDTVFCKYIIKLIDQFESDKSDEYDRLLPLLFTIIFNNSILQRKVDIDGNSEQAVRAYLNGNLYRFNTAINNKIWSKINAEEFSNVILKENNYLFSIDNWSRADD